MCGIVGVVSAHGHAPSVTERAVETMRDTMAHRGPDDATVWSTGNAVLAHRRLAVVDPDAGRQPLVSGDERFVLVYNGELYNDAELREELRRRGVGFRSRCDTETLLGALVAWGCGAASRVRGMYAFALLDRLERKLTVARDPLGVKPLFVHRRFVGGHAELTFASEVRAILAHPGISPAPDWVTVSAYLSTVRTTVGSRTLFEGVETLRPGEWRVYDLDDGALGYERHEEPIRRVEREPGDDDLRRAVDRAVVAHLRADVPQCALLSGGLDSTIIARAALSHLGSLETFGAGEPGVDPGSDLVVAASVAAELGTAHRTVPVDRGLFASRWPELVARTGLPLSTPNTVAINEVARALRARGRVVALSGEGADELFAGYGPALQLAARYESLVPEQRTTPGVFHLESNQWVAMSAKGAVLRPAVWAAAEHDRVIVERYEADFAALPEADRPGVARHLRFHRRVNLPNLLDRLDAATMLESVEGRTPFADAVVAGVAEAVPIERLFVEREGEAPATKLALRRAYRGLVPAVAVERPKASFPLPFERWVADLAPALGASSWARSVLSDGAVEAVLGEPARLWSVAWPAINLALWGERWWGDAGAAAGPDRGPSV